MEKILKISIPNYSQRQKSKPHIVYHISITAPVRSWTVQHRYNEFFTLNKRFLEVGLKPPLELPPKTSFFSFTSFDNPKFVETRRQGLEEYLQAILASKDERFKKLSEWKEFLGISYLKNKIDVEDEEANSSSFSTNDKNNGNNNNSNTNNSQNSLDLKSSEQWLEECRDLSLVINEIKTCIAARNKFVFRNDTAAACEAIVLARKNHSILCTRYGALERELHRQLNEYYNYINNHELQERDDYGTETPSGGFLSSVLGNSKKQKNKPLLSKGELSRRQDLLENIRMEKEQLEKQLGNAKSNDNIFQMQISVAPSDSAYYNSKVGSSIHNSTDSDFCNINGGINNNTTNKSKSRRKFGINISKEVEESTQGLDNIQILQLQKDMLKDQDKTLEQFSVMLNRQRRLGETINQELDLQNELLDDLDSNVNKVQHGLGQADKRMKKVLKK